MTTVEKRRSSRKSRRKQNDGGYSDTETDREVSRLTDRAFRSLCVGDEAVYNDSDLSASPCIQRDRQLAFSHTVHDEREDRDRQEMKRAAHESFSMKVQQYGQDWMYGGTYGAEIHKQQQWGVYGERGSHGRLSATFQHSFLETPQQEPPLNELSIYSNGATEVSSQQRRSRSRVSSLIRAFNSEEQRDGAVIDRKLCNDETSWDKSALMSIERELSEFSSYQQNINSGYFPSAGLFSSQNTNYYSSELAAVTQMNSASSFMRSSHSKHTMSTHVNSNFFIHSEFSPFKVWRDHSRFPFQRGRVSGFMHSSEFPKWYETPMYRELSLQPQQPSFMFEEQGMTCHRNTFASAVPMNAQRSTSTSTVMQKTPALEKRCESELAGHYPHRKRAQSLGANRLPSQRPCTASPTSEMSRQVRDTLSSVKSLQQKIKMMTEQNIDTQSQGVFYNNNLTPYGSNAMIPNDVSTYTNTGPYKMNPMLTSAIHAAPEQQHNSASPHPVEHAPVRAESRGSTTDVKMSGYRSRAASLLYNLKDNRKRVKSSYSPTKFKGLETQHKYKQEPKDFVIDVPDFPETNILNPTVKRTDRLDVGSHQYGYQTHSPGMLQNSQPAQLYMGQTPMYSSREYYRAQTQGEAAHHHGFTGFTPEYYTNNQLANGQNPHKNVSSFTASKQGVRDKAETLGNYVNRLGQSYTAAEMPRVSADSQSRDYVSEANHLNEAVGEEFIWVDRCNQQKENKCDYNNVYSQAEWEQTNHQEIQKTAVFQTKDHPNIDAYQRGNNTQEERNFPKYNCETKPNRELEKYSATPHGICHSNISNQVPHYAPLYSSNTVNVGYSAQQQPGTYRESYAPQMSQEYNQENKIQENDAPHVDHKYYNQESTKQTTFSSHGDMSMPTQESRQRKEPIVKEDEIQSLKLKETELQFENSKQKNALAATGQVQVKDEREQIKTEVDKAGLDKLNLVKNETGSERVKAKPEKGKEEQAQGMFKKDEKDKSVKTNAEKDVPAKDEHSKPLPEEKSEAQPHELQKVTDDLRHMMEGKPKRREPVEQVIVEPINTKKLKEEHIKCQLAKSSEQARIEQVKPEQSRQDSVETEQVKVPQVWAEQVLRERTEKEHSEEETRESEHAEKEQTAEKLANTQPEENAKEIEGIATAAQTEMEEAKQVELVTEDIRVRKLELDPEDPTNIKNMQESLSKPAPEKQVKSEPDKVKQAKTELAKAKAELAKIKEKMKGDQKVRKREENINKVNSNIDIYSKEQAPPVNKPSVDHADRGVDECKHVKEKYVMTTNRNKMSTREKAHSNENIETTDYKKTNTSPDIFTVTTIESNDNTKSTSHDDETESHYVYSESSKEFKLSIASNLADSDDKETNDKNASGKIVEKYDPSQQKDTSQQPPAERKSTEGNIGASKESQSTPLRALSHKERAQAKQEILTSKIKAHAEKEISAIKEGFAIRDMFKNSPKPLVKSPNMTVRQKPPSQEAFKKQDSTLLTVVAPKQISPSSGTIPVKSTGPSQPADHPQKQIKNSEAEIEDGITVNEGLSKSEKSPTQSADKYPITSQVEGEGHSSPSQKEILDGKKSKSKVLLKDKPSKDENVDKGENIDHPDLKIPAPSLQLFGQSETSVPDDSLKIMGIMVTVRERGPLERNGEEEKDIQDLCAQKNESKENGHPRSADVTKVDRLSEGVSQVHDRAAPDNSKAKENQITRQTELMTIMGKRGLTDSETEKTPQQESSLLTDRPQSKKQLTDRPAEKDVSSMDTVPAKNKELAETKPLPSKHSIVAGEKKDYTNRTPPATQATSVIKDQEEITGTKPDPQSTIEISLAAKPDDGKTQEDLHIDSIAIRVVPAVTDKGNMSEQRPISNVPETKEEANETKQMTLTNHQDIDNSNADVQKVLSSVRKQAQLLKISNQQNYNNATNGNTENDKGRDVHKTGDESKKPLTEEGYFQVERRHSVQQNNNTDAVSPEQELPRSLLNSDTISNKSLKEDKSEVLAMDKRKTFESCLVSIQEGNVKISKLVSSPSEGKVNKDEKMGAVHTHQTRKHHTARDRQSTRSLQTLQENAVTAKVEVRLKPKVSIPEISALADYARLKVIVSQESEDTVQELPPNKKEGFFPLIQSHHSRRPVFTADSQEVSVIEKSSQNKSDAPVKPSKEPKPIVFPITGIEHQRTGMFKLGDAKENKGIEDTCVKDGKPIHMEQTKPISPSNTKQNEEPNTDERIKHMVEERRTSLAEEERITTQREEERRAREREAIAIQIKERRKKLERKQEEERKAKLVEQQIDSEIKVKEEEEEQKVERILKRKEQLRTPSEIPEKPQRMSLMEQSIKMNLEKHQRSLLEEKQKKAALIDVHEEPQRKVALDEHQRKAALTEEQQRRVALENQQKKADKIDEQKRRLDQEEQPIALEEKKTKAGLEEQQRKASLGEEQNKMAQEDEQRKDTLIEEQKMSAVYEEQQRTAALEKQLRKATLGEQQRRSAALEEKKQRAAHEEQQRKAALEEQQRRSSALEEKKQRAAREEQQRKAALEEQQRTAVALEEKRQRAAREEQQRKAALEEQQRKAALEEQQRKAALEEQQRKAVLEEQQRTAVALEEKRQRAAREEQQRKAAVEEQQRKAALEEQQRTAAVLEEKRQRAAREEQQRNAALEEQQRKAVLEEQQRTAAVLEEKRQRAAREEQQRKAALEEQQRTAAALEEKKQRAAREEQQRKAAVEEQQRKAALEEQQRKAVLEEQQRTAAVLEEKRQRAAREEQQRKAALEEQQRTAAALEENKQRAAREAQQRKAALEEQQRTAAVLEEKRPRAAREEQQRKAALEEQQRTAAVLEEKRQRATREEQQRKAALEEQQRTAAVLEEKRQRAAREEQQRKAALEEQQRTAAALEEKKQRAAREEQQRKAAVEEQQRKAALEEQQRTAAALEEKKQRAAREEQQRKAALEEQQRKAALEEQQRKVAREEQQKKAALEEWQKRALQEEQKKMAQEKQQTKAPLIEEQKTRAILEEQQRKPAINEEQKMRAVHEEQQIKVALEEQQRRATFKDKKQKAALERAVLEEQHQRKAAIIEEQKMRAACEEHQRITSLEEQKQKTALKEKQIKAATEEQQTLAALTDEQKRKTADEQMRKAGVIKEQKRSVALEEGQQRRAALEEQQRKEALVDKQRQTRQVEEEKRLAYIREERIRRQIEEEKDAQIAEEMRQQSQQKSKAVQLSEKARKTKDKWRTSGKEKQMHEQGQTSLEKDTRVTKEQDLPQRETDSRAIQTANQEKASEIEEHKNVSEKTDALQYYSLTSAEAEKLSPPQQRNSSKGHDRAEDAGSYNRPHAPVSPASSLPRSSASSPAFVTKLSMFKVKDNTIRGSAFTKSIKPRFRKNFGEEFRVGSPMEQVLKKSEEEQDSLRRSAGTPAYPEPGLNKPAPTTQGYSTPVPQHRPYSRRSLVLDEEDAYSIISNMSEDVESFATSGGDLADTRALYDSERPDSACSFSSDVSRSFGKPPAVPPKSEKALRRAKRLATRRLKKEMPKAATDDAREASLTEVGVTNHNAVASPHFASPVSLAHLPTSASSLSSSHPEHPPPQRSFHASPHATAPISLPIASPHTTAPVSTPIASSRNAGPLSNSAAPKTIPDVSSSPTLHHAPTPVTQYQVESSFPQSYPVTQRRVLQDIGSGQYYVVDVPVEVKTKTFFDPETGKYVQLNVRESSRNTPQRQPLQAYPQPQLKSQVQAKAHQQPPPASKPNALYQGYPGYPKGYQSAATSCGPPLQSNSVTPATFTQDQQPIRVGHNHRYDGPEIDHRYSPEKTPYMDTVNTDKTYNAVYSREHSHGAFSVGDTNSQSRNIITMGELEDFMEASEW